MIILILHVTRVWWVTLGNMLVTCFCLFLSCFVHSTKYLKDLAKLLKCLKARTKQWTRQEKRVQPQKWLHPVL